MDGGLRIIGSGSALPDTRLHNRDLSAWLDTSDEWITSRTGIRERRIADPAQSVATLATDAARAALADAELNPVDIDLIIVATSTPESPMPSTAAHVAARIGSTAGGFDLNGACAGFAYGLGAATAMASAGLGQRLLVIGADTMTRVVDPDDRSTAVLFGDGAAALVLESNGCAQASAVAQTGVVPEPDRAGLIAADFAADGDSIGLLGIPAGTHHIRMNGRELYRRVVREVTASIGRVLTDARVSPAAVDWFVPHQANVRIVDAVVERAGLDPARVLHGGELVGNTSAASIPLMLDSARREGTVRDGETLLVCGFGAGLSVATLLWRWG